MSPWDKRMTGLPGHIVTKCQEMWDRFISQEAALNLWMVKSDLKCSYTWHHRLILLSLSSNIHIRKHSDIQRLSFLDYSLLQVFVVHIGCPIPRELLNVQILISCTLLIFMLLQENKFNLNNTCMVLPSAHSTEHEGSYSEWSQRTVWRMDLVWKQYSHNSLPEVTLDFSHKWVGEFKVSEGGLCAWWLSPTTGGFVVLPPLIKKRLSSWPMGTMNPS